MFVFSFFSPTNDVFASYDSFDTAPLDPSKWRDLEAVRKVSGGKLRLKVRGAGEQATIGMSPVEKTDYLEATVLIESGSEMLDTGGHARLIATFYNESRGPGSGQDYDGLMGEVWVTNRIWMDENRNLTALC